MPQAFVGQAFGARREIEGFERYPALVPAAPQHFENRLEIVAARPAGFSCSTRARIRPPGSTKGANTTRPSRRANPSPPYTSFSTVTSKLLTIRVTPLTTAIYHENTRSEEHTSELQSLRHLV